MVLSIIPSFSNMIEYSAMKNSIIPRIKNLCLHTTSLTVRVTLSDVVLPFSKLSKIICFPFWLLKLCLELMPKTRRILFSSPVLFGMKRSREEETIIAMGRKCKRGRAVMSNTVDMIRVEKYFSQLVRADKLSRLELQSRRMKNASY